MVARCSAVITTSFYDIWSVRPECVVDHTLPGARRTRNVQDLNSQARRTVPR